MSRTLSGVRDLDALASHMEAGENVLLEGPTGSAKTLVARAFAAAHGLPFYAIPVNGAIDPGTLWGRYVVREDRSLVWVDSPAALVLMHGGVLVWDEVNMAHPRILSAFHELLDDRRSVTVLEHEGDVIKSHAATLYVATMNPGYGGTAELNEAFRRRQDAIISWPYLPEVERVLVESSTLLEFANEVRALPEVRTDLSTASLVRLEDMAGSLGLAYASERLVSLFRESERGGVRRALDLYLPAIASDLGLSASGLTEGASE